MGKSRRDRLAEEYLAARSPYASKITKKLAGLFAEFDLLVVELLEDHGARSTGERHGYPFVIDTKFGPLRVSPHDGWIATRFDDVEPAAKRLGSNPYTGKWNFHFEDFRNEDEVFRAFESFKRQLLAIL